MTAGKERARDLARLWRQYRKSAPSGAPSVSIGFAASFTIDPLLDYTGALVVDRGGTNPSLLNANYNQLVRVCLDPASEFGDADLEAIVLLFRLEDLSNTGDAASTAEAVDVLLGAIGQLRQKFGGTIIVGLPPRPRGVAEGLTGFANPSAMQQVWFDVLGRTTRAIAAMPNAYTVDLEAAIAALGEAEALDHRKLMLYRQPYADVLYVDLAERILRIHAARKVAAKKCVVLDCDNTLWGGVIGEDGVGGVQLSDDYPGRAFLLFQRQLKALRDTGIFLALNTKNNPDDVLEMFRTHSAMALREEDISVMRINWQPKSQNLKEIAAELNIGLDALVFVDDNPFEVEEVRAHAPGVTVIQVPEDTADLPEVFRAAAPLFDRLDITEDDRKRVDMMRHEMERRELSQKLTEADFLATLGLEITLFKPAETDHARVTQLINKTNQFNVTTRRYSHEEVAAITGDADYDLYCASVRDRFGDYGLVGVGIVRHMGEEAEFDSLLMSCRVLGRGVETAMLAHGVELAAARGERRIIGRYIPTRKNGMVADLFDKHGFSGDASDSERVLVRSTDPLPVPNYLAVRLDAAS